MDLDKFRSLYQSAGVDIWTVIDMALTVASIDFFKEFKVRRDRIAERLFAKTTTHCLNCDGEGTTQSASKIKVKPKSALAMEEKSNEEEYSHDGETHNSPPHTPYNDDNEEFADETLNGNQGGNYVVKEIRRRKVLLEDSDQPHNVLLDALQDLDNMDISVEFLKETDIGRQVNGLRKHSSVEVRKLVKQLIRKWKDLVDEWVNTAGEVAAAAIVDGNSPQVGGRIICQLNSVQKCHASSNCGPSVCEKDGWCDGRKPSMMSDSKHKGVNQGSANSVNNSKTSDFSPCESPQLIGDAQRSKNHMKQDACLSQKSNMNVSPSEMLASARKRLREKYQEAENAKRQRTVQMMELQDLPKFRNTFISHGNLNKSKHHFYGK